MAQVVERLEDIATTRLEAERAAQAAAAAAAAEAEAAAAAAAVAEAAKAVEAAAAQQAATDAAEAAHADEAAAAAAQAGQLCRLRTGGLARALSQQARDAAAGGAAADLAAAQQHLQHLLQQQQSGDGSALAAGHVAPAGPAAAGVQGAGAPHHRFEVLIENDDDPITAEAVAHTLEQFEAGSLLQILSGHPYAVQQASHAVAEASANGSAAAAAPAARSLHHSATAPVHSHLLDTAAEAAAAAEGLAGVTESRRKSGVAGGTGSISITGAVSRANIELRPAEGPGLVPRDTPPLSPTAAAAAAAAAGGSAAAGGAGMQGSGSVPSGSWYLASGSSFKKGMWLEKTATGQLGSAGGAGGLNQLRVHSMPAQGANGSPAQQQPLSPMVESPLSLGAAVAVPESGTPTNRNSFSLQLRRESQALPTVNEDGLDGAWQLGAEGEQPGATAGAAAAATGEAAAARALRRSHTTRRLSTDVLAAAGALSKALSAFSSASQALPAVAAAGEVDVINSCLRSA